MEKVSNTLQPMGDVVTQIENGLDESFLIIASFNAILIRHNQFLAHIISCHEHLDSGLAVMMLRVWLSEEEWEDRG